MTEPSVDVEAVWQAYRAMAESKRRHIDRLQALEAAYIDSPHSPSAHEQAELDECLRAHDTNVQRFKVALGRLRIEDPPGYALLIQRLMADAQSDNAE